MKGYWINHVLEIKDEPRFSAYVAASKPLLQGNNRYGALLKVFGPVSRTVQGSPVQFAALVEFDSVQAAVDFWEDESYAAARLLMGSLEDETAVVDRRVCCIEAERIAIKPGQSFWLNHVHEILDENAFFKYADASLAHFTTTGFGPVVHQHAGQQLIKMAAALGVAAPHNADTLYQRADYRKALAVGGMTEDESRVVNRTICAVAVPL